MKLNPISRLRLEANRDFGLIKKLTHFHNIKVEGRKRTFSVRLFTTRLVNCNYKAPCEFPIWELNLIMHEQLLLGHILPHEKMTHFYNIKA